ncbi:MAG: UbiA family prenyltransferase [Planctomycetota bacterium]|nr:UbiA family prenyltransferase [Planctomycetota bacterium]
MRSWLRIVRLPLAPTAACDALACGALAWAVGGVGLASVGWTDWVSLAGTSLLLFGTGMALNDWADRTVDRQKAPQRPLPSGALHPAAVLILVVLMAASAVWLGGGPRGFLPAVIAALALATLYDLGGRKDGPEGAVVLGLVRFSNASLAVWPVVLDGGSWWLLAAPACIGCYATGITLLSQTEDRPDDRRVRTARILTAIAFATAAVLVWLLGELPTFGIAVAFGVGSSTLFGRTPKPGPVKRQVLEMLLGLYWLAAIVAGGAHDGTLAGAVVVSFCALVAAWLLAMGSQLLIRALR